MIRYERQLEGGDRIVIVCTERADGDFCVPPAGETIEFSLPFSASTTVLPRFWMRQQHGTEIANVCSKASGEFQPDNGATADSSITAETFMPLSVTTADCLPIAVWSAERGIGVIHAGWRGLNLGIVQKVTEAMSQSFGDAVSAFIGPHICAECYEFSSDDAQEFIRQWGSDVYLPGDNSNSGKLNLRLVAESALRQAGVSDITCLRSCTACETKRWFSHRARQETERMAMVAWRERGNLT